MVSVRMRLNRIAAVASVNVVIVIIAWRVLQWSWNRRQSFSKNKRNAIEAVLVYFMIVKEINLLNMIDNKTNFCRKFECF